MICKLLIKGCISLKTKQNKTPPKKNLKKYKKKFKKTLNCHDLLKYFCKTK